MIGSDESKRILSLRDPTKKQSKSDASGASRITLRDPPEAIFKKIKKALTDFTGEITYDPMIRPGVSNLINIYSQLKDVSVQQIVEEAKEMNTGQWVFDWIIVEVVSEMLVIDHSTAFYSRFKLLVANELIAQLDPIRLQIEDYLKNTDYLVAVLRDGRDKASETAERTMTEVRERVGTMKL